MKICGKVWHIAIIEKNNLRSEINKMLQLYRATPHPTTGQSPEELLFRTKISQPTSTPAIDTSHNMQLCDQVLLKQRSTKSKPPYDPEQFVVTSINVHQITAERGQQRFTMDAQKWKHVHPLLNIFYFSQGGFSSFSIYIHTAAQAVCMCNILHLLYLYLYTKIRDTNRVQMLNFHFIIAKGTPFPQISVGGDCSTPKTT